MDSDTRWPAITWEDQEWTPSPLWDTRGRPGDAVRYRSAVPPMIAALTPKPGGESIDVALEAAQELGRFEAEMGTRVSAFAPVLLRSEAASSSQIENLTSSARAIFTAELGGRTGPNAALIAANARAMQAAIQLSDSVDAGSILRMHAVLMEGQARHSAGNWRTEAVWIGRRSDSPVGAMFVAPHHTRVIPLIDDLVTFSRRTDIPALIAVPVAHAQFETIHPFTDGNGRTGRVLAQSLLRHRGITRSVAVPVSAGLLSDVDGYYSALTAFREGDVDPIVIAFSRAACRAVANARRLVADIDHIRESWGDRLTVRRDSNAWRLLDVLARCPVLNAATAARELGIASQNVYPPMRALQDAGIVTSRHEHGEGPFWRSDEVLAAIDAFAERAGRREAAA